VSVGAGAAVAGGRSTAGEGGIESATSL